MSDAALPLKRRYVLGLPFWVYIVLAAAGAVTFIQTQIGDQGMANGFTWPVMLLTGLLCLAWFTLFSGYAKPIRWGVAGLAMLLLGALVLCVRIEGISGNLFVQLAWRWSPRSIEREPAAPPAEPSLDLQRVDLTTPTPHDFPQFLGPQRDGSVPGIKLNRDWEAHPPKEMWRQPIGAGWSGFTVVNGFAVTLEQRRSMELVTCYEVETGKLRWSYGSETRYESTIAGVGPRSTPTIYQGRVYALGATGKFYCLDGATGQPVWQKDLLKEFGMTGRLEDRLVKYGRSNSPLIVNDLVIVPAGGPEEGRRWSLAAFHHDNGAIIWKAGTRNISHSSPALAVLAGVPQILSVNENTASGHDPKTGDILWETDWPGETSKDANNSQPVPIPPDRVLLSKGYGVGAKLIQLKRKDDGSMSATTIYQRLGSRPGNMRTKFTNVTIHDAYVYGLSDGILECMELDTGRRVWRDGAYGHGQILRVDDLILVLSEEGELALVEATPERPHNQLGRIQVLEGPTWNNLALYGSYLLVKNGQKAVCYQLATE